MEAPLFIGVDVGSGSVRAALVDIHGEIHRQSIKDIKTWSPKPNYFQQSSSNIWESCIETIKDLCSGVDPSFIKGIGFDATCSLVAVGKRGQPVSISPNGEAEQDVIMWMDHRADKEANFINTTAHSVLKNMGGKISLEMEIPKLLWLKKNLPQCWTNAELFFDLPDFLTWKATNSTSRSLCSLVCKWTYKASPCSKNGWDFEFFKQIGLLDLLDDDCRKIGNVIKLPGDPCGQGLRKDLAIMLNILPGTPVSTSIIDAHAGGLGLLGCKIDHTPIKLCSRLSLICGTSTCHMALSKNELFVKGVWGPYYSAMVPRLWLNEAGQSATGKLIDHIIDSHPASNEIKKMLPSGERIEKYLNSVVESLAEKREIPFDTLTQHLHMWPDFHGNRSPIADPSLKGMVSGLDLGNGVESLALIYLSTLQYGTRHIMEAMEEEGHRFETILACGGLSKNSLFLKSQANIVGKSVLIPKATESVLIGAAILAASASGVYPSVELALHNMGGDAMSIEPNTNILRYHNNKYRVFKKMLEHQYSYIKMMEE